MPNLGLYLELEIGPVVAPIPAPANITECLESVTIKETDQAPTGFQIIFSIAREPLPTGAAIPDYKIMIMQELNPGRRIRVITKEGILPSTLLDGIITNQEIVYDRTSNKSKLIVTGEDLSILMDMTEKIFPFPSMNANMIADAILAEYAEYTIMPEVIPATLEEIPDPAEHIPMQHGTDLAMLRQLAKEFGYVFNIQPEIEGAKAYWGPRQRTSMEQPALIVNAGTFTNVEKINFRYNGLAPTRVTGLIQDGRTNLPMPVEIPMASIIPPLALEQATEVQGMFVRTSLPVMRGGNVVEAAEAMARGRVNITSGQAIIVEGELNVERYGHILRPNGLVGVEGAGATHDGSYYVQQVTHSISKAKGEFTQKFVLSREGLTGIQPDVVPDITE